jgi:putative transposase
MSENKEETQEAAGSAAAGAEGHGKIISIDEGRIKEHLSGVVLKAVEETLNALLDTEADRLCGAKRCERSEDQTATRVGHYERQLHTKAGEVSLKEPKLRSLPFETAIIERYKRRESSVEEALIEMYLAGVSVRRVGDSESYNKVSPHQGIGNGTIGVVPMPLRDSSLPDPSEIECKSRLGGLLRHYHHKAA